VHYFRHRFNHTRHPLTTRNPLEIWLALGHQSWSPRGHPVGLRIVRLSGPAMTEVIETHPVEGVALRVYSPAKTVADCFKSRHKLGLDVALEARRETWRACLVTMPELEHFARVGRVAGLVSPQLTILA